MTNIPSQNEPTSSTPSALGWVALAAAPLFFSTNIVFGRAANTLDPFILSFLRWSISATILMLIIRPHWKLARNLIANHWKLLLLCGFLAMWVCGALVYLALQYTTATNGTLIYTTPPLLIIIIERFTRGRKIRIREVFGIFAALFGIVTIITNGDITKLAALQFNRGDLMFILAAVSWAIYTLLLRKKAFDNVPTLVTFALTAIFGAMTLAPYALAELLTTAHYPQSIKDWQMVAGIVLFSSLIPFSLYQFGNRIHGAASASVFMYLLPPFGLALAWLMLGEVPNANTLLGCAFVLGGVILATVPARFFSQNPSQ